jgi:hypothetical protein
VDISCHIVLISRPIIWQGSSELTQLEHTVFIVSNWDRYFSRQELKRILYVLLMEVNCMLLQLNKCETACVCPFIMTNAAKENNSILCAVVVSLMRKDFFSSGTD